MVKGIVCLVFAALAVTAAGTALSASREPDPAGEVEILVNGAAQRQYPHDGRSYVEALKGREYTIRLRNPYGVRVAVALSVDGLNTIDARHTSPTDARKWVLGPYQTVEIIGWQTSRNDARRFEFTTEAKSYAQALGASANLGVISAVFFRERAYPVMTQRQLADADRRESAAPSAKPAPAEERAQANASSARKAVDEYAATGMGQRTDNRIVQVWMDLEDTPARAVDIRYEFRAQLVKLGVLPEPPKFDPLARRERARGFEPGFSPMPR